MSDGDLVTRARHVAWRIKSKKAKIVSKDFIIDKWYWYLECSKKSPYVYTNSCLCLKLKEAQDLPFQTVSFVVHVFRSEGPHVTTTHEFMDRNIINGAVHVQVDTIPVHTATFTLGLELLALKMVGKDGKSYSVWDGELSKNYYLSTGPLVKMLTESIYSDIVVNAMDGSIQAHRAVLAANSPVFNIMFSENYMESLTSTVNIIDMSIGGCKAMLNFIYGKRERSELRAHINELILAADKYDIVNLKKACDASLCDNVDANNVFERLVYAHKYELVELKSTCLFYLVTMGMIYALRDDYNNFLREADPELTVFVSNACLDALQATDMVTNKKRRVI